MKTTIVVDKETRNKLALLGTKDSTFDEIISKLIEKKGNGVTDQVQPKPSESHDLEDST